MAEITIKLDTNAPEDMDMIEQIIGSFHVPGVLENPIEDIKAEMALPPPEEPPAPKPKKPRRTKAEMAAARAEEAAAKKAVEVKASEGVIEEPFLPPEDPGKVETTTLPPTTPAPTEDADIDFGDFETPVDDKRTTAQWRADLVAGLNLLHAADPRTAKGIMSKHDFAKVGSLDPLKYSAVLRDVQKALDATK